MTLRPYSTIAKGFCGAFTPKIRRFYTTNSSINEYIIFDFRMRFHFENTDSIFATGLIGAMSCALTQDVLRHLLSWFLPVSGTVLQMRHGREKATASTCLSCLPRPCPALPDTLLHMRPENAQASWLFSFGISMTLMQLVKIFPFMKLSRTKRRDTSAGLCWPSGLRILSSSTTSPVLGSK